MTSAKKKKKKSLLANLNIRCAVRAGCGYPNTVESKAGGPGV